MSGSSSIRSLFTQRIFKFLKDLLLDQLLFEKDELLRTVRDA